MCPVRALILSGEATKTLPGALFNSAAQFEYQPAYLPVNRLADGAMHD
ncbi:MAG TPA: hypothetical protein VGH72_30345 [Pseudonocardia sp.]